MRTHTGPHAQIPAHIPIPDHARPPPQLFLSPDLSPPISEAKLALPTQPEREDSKTFIFHFKEASIRLARTCIWANACAEEN